MLYVHYGVFVILFEFLHKLLLEELRFLLEDGCNKRDV